MNNEKLFIVIWCRKVNSYKKYEEDWDAFHTYQDAKDFYDELVNRNTDNVKLCQVIEEPSKGLYKQEFYV